MPAASGSSLHPAARRCRSTARSSTCTPSPGRRTVPPSTSQPQAPLTHEQEDAQKDEWKDVIRWREQYRGDLLLKLSSCTGAGARIGCSAAGN